MINKLNGSSVVSFDADEWVKLNGTIELATGEDREATAEIVEAIGNDDHATKALIMFMDGISIGTNPTLEQIKYNQQLTNNLFKHIAEYVVKS